MPSVLTYRTTITGNDGESVVAAEANMASQKTNYTIWRGDLDLICTRVIFNLAFSGLIGVTIFLPSDAVAAERTGLAETG